ncbi:hypothetical protein [Brevundimonas sp.]|uniref:hypothetical protein n=1 Tax=Brevundimonas sp. TaxID=1871086 RepID=UPI00257FA78C|nr:hypothetical protein [Brevundimonas sp.]
MVDDANPIRRLELPRRWELLAQRAEEVDADPSGIVERVDEAAARVDTLLRRVRDGGGGAIEVFFGLSGSGKTTFLQNLPSFFEGVSVSTFDKDRPLSELPEFVKKGHVPGASKNRIVLVTRRDNPTASDLNAVEEMFAELLEVFREPGGAAVVLWPITKKESADFISEKAWEVGRDSMADAESNGQYKFVGVAPSKYWDIADNTSRTITGDGLEAFGIMPSDAAEMLTKSETISDFFAAALSHADKQRANTWSILKEKANVHLWVLLPGDDLKLLNATADALTQGTKSKIDIDKIGELIDRPDQNTIYVADWKERRGKLAHLLRAIDVRLFGFPPNVSLAAVRSFGDSSLKARLKQPATTLDASKSAMRATRLYKAILAEAGVETPAYAGARRLGQETIDEFLRIQGVASSDDKPLNKALGSLIAACLAEDAPNLKVVSEKKIHPRQRAATRYKNRIAARRIHMLRADMAYQWCRRKGRSQICTKYTF